MDLLKVPFIEDNYLVCEDENQTKSIWKFENEKWETIAFWNRHNKIAKNLWELKEIPATWFWLDTKKIINLMIENKIEVKNKSN